MFLIDDDKGEIGDGRKNCGAGADDDARFAAANPMPLRGAFRGGQRGMEQGHLRAEAGAELRDHGGSEANFRDQKETGQSCVEHAPHGRDVDGGFAGAGDAVQEEGLEFSSVDSGRDLQQGFSLGIVQHRFNGDGGAGQVC